MNHSIKRQGDLFTVKISKEQYEALLKDKSSAKTRQVENGRIILLHGEATGHNHSVPETVTLIEAESLRGARAILDDIVPTDFQFIVGVMVAPEPVEIVHIGHHTPMPIEEGYHLVWRAREYTPEQARAVWD